MKVCTIMPSCVESQVVEVINDSADGSNEINLVTILSHPNVLVKDWTKVPASEGTQVDPNIKVESLAEKVTV